MMMVDPSSAPRYYGAVVGANEAVREAANDLRALILERSAEVGYVTVSIYLYLSIYALLIYLY